MRHTTVGVVQKKNTKVSRVVNYNLSNIVQILSHCATISHTKNSYVFILEYVVPLLFTFNLVILGAFGTYPFRSLIPAVSISAPLPSTTGTHIHCKYLSQLIIRNTVPWFVLPNSRASSINLFSLGNTPNGSFQTSL